MPVFEKAFGIAAGHSLRTVRFAPMARGAGRDGWIWEHEEYDTGGTLVAVYESWTSGPPLSTVDIAGFIKY